MENSEDGLKKIFYLYLLFVWILIYIFIFIFSIFLFLFFCLDYNTKIIQLGNKGGPGVRMNNLTKK